jgi:hypothetical protein
MAFDSSNLVNISGMAPGQADYVYVSDTDTRATVMGSGYFNNTDDDQNLAVDDRVHVRGDQGFYTLRVDTVSSGVVTTESADGAVWLTAELTDVSTASSTWLAAPFDGVIGRVKTILHGAISGADADVGLEIGGTDVTGGQVTIANSGSAAGDVDESVATAANTVTEGQAVEVDTDGASTGAVSVTVMVEFIPA